MSGKKMVKRPGRSLTDKELEAKAAFLNSGKAPVPVGAVATDEDTKRRVGRPSRAEAIKRMQIGLRQADVDELELLVLQWKRTAGASTSVPITAVLRSLLAVSLPSLKNMLDVEDEDDLRQRLARLFEV